MHRFSLLLASLSFATAAGASQLGDARGPANAAAPAAALAYDSAFTGYQSYVEPVVADWKQTNAAIAGSSSHAGHAPPTATAKPDAHAGHDMSAMKASKPDPHAGHDMAAMKASKPDPHAGHDMAAMKSAKPDEHAGHDMAASKRVKPAPAPKAKVKAHAVPKPDPHAAHQH